MIYIRTPLERDVIEVLYAVRKRNLEDDVAPVIASQAGMAARIGRSLGAVSEVMRNLVASGDLEIVRRRVENRGSARRQHIHTYRLTTKAMLEARQMGEARR